jgi:hypothetical protein
MMPVAAWSVAMNRIVWLGGLLAFIGVTFVGVASPVAAQDIRPNYFGPSPAPCYFCIRDAIYEDVKLINHLEANPDIDEGAKGPEIVAARADIHRLRQILGPLVQTGTEPCCYSRLPLYIR